MAVFDDRNTGIYDFDFEYCSDCQQTACVLTFDKIDTDGKNNGSYCIV